MLSREYCPSCDRDTPHDVRVKILEESDADDSRIRGFSREPYRIRTCQACGGETAQRMNGAHQSSA